MILIILVSLLLIVSPVYFCEHTRADWVYTVRRGDTLFKVAQKTGLSVREIRQRSGIRRNRLRIGERLIIPSSRRSNWTGSRVTGNLKLLAHVINGEAANEPYIGKVAVGGVIMNRIQNSRFPKTIAGVVYQPHAFESVTNGIFNRPYSNESLRAASDAIGGWDPSGGALYFFNPAKTNHPWIWARSIITQIGRHIFAR
jgi:LysM repeat protein